MKKKISFRPVSLLFLVSSPLLSPSISRRCHGYSRLLKPSCSLPSRRSRRHLILIFFAFLASTSAHPRGSVRRRQGRRRGSGAWPRCGRSAAAASTTGSTRTPAGPSTQLVPPCPLSDLIHSLLLAGYPRLLFLNAVIW